MTRFWRSGFSRTSSLGTTHWVEGHWVERDDWDRWSSSYADIQSHWRHELSSLGWSGSWSSRYVLPNATCPVCGAPVFFYQNEFGSKVFFDELGPPWPKHPCTDNAIQAARDTESTSAYPVAHATEAIQRIHELVGYIDDDGETSFRATYKLGPWQLCEVLKRVASDGKTYLILRLLSSGRKHTLFVRCAALPRAIAQGSVVAVFRKNLSFFDPAALLTREIQIERFRTPAAFINSFAGLNQ